MVDDTKHESALVLDDLAWKDLAAIAEEFLATFEPYPALDVELQRQLTLARRIVEVA